MVAKDQGYRDVGKPVPDPTVLTTDAILREIERLEKLMLAEITGLSTLLDEKILRLSDQVAWSKALRDEEFRSVGTQFDLIERRRVEQKKDTKDAVDAALAAAKEAVKEQTTASDRSITKSETATSEQLKQMTLTFTTAISGSTAAIDDVKERISKIESAKVGGRESISSAYAAVGLIITLLLLALGAANFIAIHH